MGLSTFSIVACDEANGDLGIAVASRFPAVGAVVPWAEVGVGAVAVQALPGPGFGPRALRWLAAGRTPDQTLAALLSDDSQRDERQVGIVDARGRPASYTGANCDVWAGGATGPGYAAQGNILAGPDVVVAMERIYRETMAPLPERLLIALSAGQEFGGDRRGRQSAALLVVRPGGGYLRSSDRYVDLRVDDHATPIDELRRLLTLHRLLFETSRDENLVPVDSARATEVQELLLRTGDLQRDVNGEYDAQTRAALRSLFGRENLEERWRDDDRIDSLALTYLQERFPET